MNQKGKRIKTSKLKRGMVSSHPEVVLGLRLMKRLGIGEELKKGIRGIFERKREEKAEKLINSLIALYISGGKGIKDIVALRRDGIMERLYNDKFFYSPNRLAELILKIRENKDIMKSLERSILKITIPMLKEIIREKGIKEITIDIDVSYVRNKGKGARRNYKGEKSMREMIVSVKETGQIIYGYVDEGDKAAHSELSEVMNKVILALKEEGIFSMVKRKIVISDSAGYRREFIKTLRENGIEWIVKARKDEGIKGEYMENKDRKYRWKKFKIIDKSGRDREYEWMVVPYVMGNNPRKMEGYKVYFYREKVRNENVLPLYEYDANWIWFGIATNGEYEGEELLKRYNERGGSENIIKEFKWDMGMRKFGSGDIERNNIVLYLH